MTAATIEVDVRYFAAARAAAGMEAESLRIEPGTTIADLVVRLSERGPRLAAVLQRCSFLCDGIAVRDRTEPLESARTIDVLPPFAGG